MGAKSLVSTLLASFAIGITAQTDAIMCPPQFINSPPPSNCQLKPLFGTIKSLYNYYVLELCSIASQFAHISYQLNVVIVIMLAVMAVVIVERAPSIRPKGHALIGVRGKMIQSRVCYSGLAAALELAEDNLESFEPTPACTNEYAKRSILSAAQSASSTVADGASRLCFAARGLQPNSLNDTVLGVSIYSEEPTVVMPGSRWGHFNLIQQSPLGIDVIHLDHPKSTLGSLVASFWPTSLLCPNFPEQWYITRIANTLLGSLRGRCPTLFVLVIAVDEAVHDLEILQLMSEASNPKQINFRGLAVQVSLAKVYDKIKQLYDEATELPGSELLVLLTGHGNSTKGMHLCRDEFINETDLYEFFELLKLQDTNSTPISVTILFDICREDQKPSIDPPAGITLIWSCSPGENAHAFRLQHDPKVPHSCTPKGDVACAPGSTSFARNHSKNMNGILRFAEALLGTETVQEAYRHITMDALFRRVNKLPLLNQADQRSTRRLSLAEASAADTGCGLRNVSKCGPSSHVRGVNELVHAG
ncbi:hypothetical protein B0J17DRAFT_646865 [Rhizoctonia solani]|nr:hypothetical protein B0J17DRAFT_646865 [Rhizoctonia solani]